MKNINCVFLFIFVSLVSCTMDSHDKIKNKIIIIDSINYISVSLSSGKSVFYIYKKNTIKSIAGIINNVKISQKKYIKWASSNNIEVFDRADVIKKQIMFSNTNICTNTVVYDLDYPLLDFIKNSPDIVKCVARIDSINKNINITLSGKDMGKIKLKSYDDCHNLINTFDTMKYYDCLEINYKINPFSKKEAYYYIYKNDSLFISGQF